MSDFAPRIITIKINPEKIRDIIGKGGSMIRKIQEETGTEINVEDDGTRRDRGRVRARTPARRSSGSSASPARSRSAPSTWAR